MLLILTGQAEGFGHLPALAAVVVGQGGLDGLLRQNGAVHLVGGQAAQRLCAAGETPDVIVVDPPRKGLSADVIEAMVRMAPQRMVYVSCDPATLARDVRSLTQQGYALAHAEAVDLFPRCAHVETVCRLERLK